MTPAVTGVADDPRLARLWVAAHRRLEQTGGRIDGTSIRLVRPTDDERSAADRLLGRRSRGRDLTIRLEDLDAALRRVDSTLVDLVRSRVGNLRDIPGERAASRAATEALWSALQDHPALVRHPALGEWLDTVRTAGRWRRLDDPALRLRQALDVLAVLPSERRVGRMRLSSDVVGSAHLLDDTAPVGRLVLRALMHLAPDDAVGDQVGRAAGRRRLWFAFGVTADETSSNVLTTGLRPLAAGPATEAAARWADGHLPLVVTLAAAEAEAWRVAAGTRVWACENPAVIAAAADLDVPMVCVEGWPSLAAERLMASLLQGGAEIAYHGDFGSGGIAIANAVVDQGAEPWRMSTRDHADALAHARSIGVDLPPLRGAVPTATWDPDLAAAITVSGVEVEEELVLDRLLDDLRGSP